MTAICCNMPRSAASAASASSRRQARRRRRAAKGIEIVEDFFGAELASELAAEGRLGRSDGRQQRAGPCARHQRFRRRLCAAAEAERRRDLRISAPAQHGAREPVRYRLSRALFLSVADRGRAASSKPTGCPSSTSRRRHGMAAACVSSRSAAIRGTHAGHRSRRQPRLRPSETAGMLDDAFYAGFQAGGAGRARRLPRLPDREPAAGPEGRRLWRGGQGQHADQLRRRQARPDCRSSSTRTRPSRALLLPGSRIPVVTEEFLKAEKPERVVILPWNLQAEIRQQLSYISDWGGKFVTAVPTLTVHP